MRGAVLPHGSVAAHATTMNPWAYGVATLTGGAVTFTDIADASYVGQQVLLIMNAAHIFTDGAVFDVQGGASYTAAAGDQVLIVATAVDAFDVTIFKANGAAVTSPPRENLLINPNWQIDQIAEGALYTINAPNIQGPDGWTGFAQGAGVFKLRTLADPDDASQKCLEITCTTADASLGASDRYMIYSAVEGYDAAGLQAGTSGAQSVTVQFKFKTSVTGTYGVSIQNSAVNRSYVSTITVADTSEHEYSVTLTMDTSGTWLYTNGVGLYLVLSLASGTDYQTTANSWQAGAFDTTSAQANLMSANTNIAYLKRIQLIPGALVQAYKPADIQGELAKCQRYYCKTFAQGTAVAQNIGTGTGETQWHNIAAGAAATVGFQATYPIEMRADPSVTLYNPAAANAQIRDISAAADWTVSSAVNLTRRIFRIQGTQPAGSGVTGISGVHWTANARLS